MVRRILNAVMTLGVIGVVVIIAARVAEPSVRPILYPASVSPATTVVLAPAETSAEARTQHRPRVIEMTSPDRMVRVPFHHECRRRAITVAIADVCRAEK